MKRLRTAHVLPAAALLALSLSAQAGDCRQELRPLLLDTSPDSARLAAVRGLCEREAETGDADAVYQLSFFHLGLAGQWDPDAGIALIRRAAALGIAEAQYWLAWQSEAGPLLAHDQDEALAWYERAAAARHRLALGRLAIAYERGELGLSVDLVRALELRAEIRRCEEEEARSQAAIP